MGNRYRATRESKENKGVREEENLEIEKRERGRGSWKVRVTWC